MLLFPYVSFATIPFDVDGKWNTTFDCVDWVWPNSGSCDDLTLTGGGEGGVMVNKTSITSSANYSEGLGGKGIRYWVNDGDDVLSAGIYANLPSPSKELWVRYYSRWESGFKWLNGIPNYQKSLYIRTYPSGDPSALAVFWGNDIGISNQGGFPQTNAPRAIDKGWGYIYPGNISDGSWHSYEFYIKMNSIDGSQDGEGRIWVDGVLVTEQLDVNWNGVAGEPANIDALQGFIQILFRSNQYWPNNGKEMYIDYDDMVIYNTTPPNKDAAGNDYIGPIGTTPTPSESDGYYSLRVGNPGVSVNNGLNVGTGGIFLGGASQDVSCNALLLSDSVNALLLSDGVTALILSE